MVVPTKRIPRLFKSLEIPSDKLGPGLPRLIDDRPVRPVPEVGVKAPPLLPDGPKNPGIVHRRPDLPLVADDPRVLHQGLDLLLPIGADPLQIEAVEGPAEGLPLVEDTRYLRVPA